MVQASFPVQKTIIVNLQDKIKSKKLGIEFTLFTVKKYQGMPQGTCSNKNGVSTKSSFE